MDFLNTLRAHVASMVSDCEAIGRNYAAENRMADDIVSVTAPRPALLAPEEPQ